MARICQGQLSHWVLMLLITFFLYKFCYKFSVSVIVVLALQP